MKKLLLLVPFLLFAFTSRFLPGYDIQIKCDKILSKRGFDICYSCTLKNPKAVIYEIDGDLLKKHHYKRTHLRFKPDYSLPATCRSYPKDISRSGYDKGHNAPNGAFNYNKTLQKETFLMSNIAPQAPKFNRNLWAKIEKFARYEAVKYKKVRVITGTCGSIGNLGKRRHYVNIPAYFYKIIFLPNGKIISFLAPNRNSIGKDKIRKYLVNLPQIENTCKFSLIKRSN